MLNNNRDRGRIKWTAMMLPEHIGKLREWHDEDNKIKRPELDGFELELIADEIERARKSKSTIKLTYWCDGYLKNDYGIISIDRSSRSLVLDDPFTTTRYALDEIIALSLID